MQPVATARVTPRTRRGGASTVAAVLVLLVAALTLGVTPVRVLHVSAGSMSPTLADGSVVLVLPAPRVALGDVVVAEDPRDGRRLVKRVVALGGQRVELADGVLVVDGAAVCEPLIDRSRVDGVYGGPWTVGREQAFLLGDARGESVDSRVFGAVPLDALHGRVALRVWPHPGPLPDPMAGC